MIRDGWVDMEFDISGVALILYFALYLDTDGDGNVMPSAPAEARSIVYLRSKKVNPPNNPFILGAEGTESTVRPNQNVQIGSGSVHGGVWLATIEELER